MGPKTEKLIKVLDQLVEILNIDNDLHWKNWFKQANERLMTSDFSGIEKVLSAYGGMGSFNDFYLGDEASSKKKFNKLRAEAWRLAKDIKHEYETHITRDYGRNKLRRLA